MKNWGIALLLMMGIGVGVVSLYMASLTGVMAKMGLVGGDIAQSIDTNELARRTRGMESQYRCDIWAVTRAIPNYWRLRGEGRVEAAKELGQERIECGIRYVRAGNFERGIYTMVKGLHYLRNRHGELRVSVAQASSKCGLVGAPIYEGWVEAYLTSAEGNAQRVVLDIYKQVEVERAGVEELCTD